MSSASDPSVEDWGGPAIAPRGPAYFIQRSAAVLAFVAVAGLVTFVLGPRIGLLGVMAINIFLVAIVFMWANNQGLLALRRAGAMRLSEEDEPRLWNVVNGLASDMKITAPALYVVPGGGPNAMVCRARGDALAITRALLETYTRTELEAVLAHSLVRLSSVDLDRASLGVALGPLGSRSIPVVGLQDDVVAVAVTRYPPALAAAIEKAEPRSGRQAPFWFVATGSSHRSASERAAALRDL